MSGVDEQDGDWPPTASPDRPYAYDGRIIIWGTSQQSLQVLIIVVGVHGSQRAFTLRDEDEPGRCRSR
jgi:hypothetical protein